MSEDSEFQAVWRAGRATDGTPFEENDVPPTGGVDVREFVTRILPGATAASPVPAVVDNQKVREFEDKVRDGSILDGTRAKEREQGIAPASAANMIVPPKVLLQRARRRLPHAAVQSVLGSAVPPRVQRAADQAKQGWLDGTAEREIEDELAELQIRRDRLVAEGEERERRIELLQKVQESMAAIRTAEPQYQRQWVEELAQAFADHTGTSKDGLLVEWANMPEEMLTSAIHATSEGDEAASEGARLMVDMIVNLRRANLLDPWYDPQLASQEWGFDADSAIAEGRTPLVPVTHPEIIGDSDTPTFVPANLQQALQIPGVKIANTNQLRHMSGVAHRFGYPYNIDFRLDLVLDSGGMHVLTIDPDIFKTEDGKPTEEPLAYIDGEPVVLCRAMLKVAFLPPDQPIEAPMAVRLRDYLRLESPDPVTGRVLAGEAAKGFKTTIKVADTMPDEHSVKPPSGYSPTGRIAGMPRALTQQQQRRR